MVEEVCSVTVWSIFLKIEASLLFRRNQGIEYIQCKEENIDPSYHEIRNTVLRSILFLHVCFEWKKTQTNLLLVHEQAALYFSVKEKGKRNMFIALVGTMV